MVRSVVRQKANFLAHLPWTVRLTIMKIPRQLDIGRHSGHCARTARNSDVGSGNKHSRTNNVAAIDRVAKSDVVQSPVNPNVSHRGKTGFECDARIAH